MEIDQSIEDFCTLNNLERFITKPAYYKKHKNTTAIDVIFTNRPSCFQHNNSFDTGTSDFNLLVAAEHTTGFK